MKLRLANVLCLIRIAGSFTAGYLLLSGSHSEPRALALLIIIGCVLLDAIDGRVARYFGQADEVGTLADLFADHIFANTIWVCLALLGLVSPWVPLVTTSRDMVVDWFRESNRLVTKNGFEQVARSHLHWLCSSRTMRALYGGAKVTTWVLVLVPVVPGNVAVIVTWLAVTMCLVRALPSLTSGWRTILFFHESCP